ncbi:hypothetical protein EPN44_13630 [bacterium]|nr:MAG: hypothetical protein EPN44_13630 [bacterium]
MGDAQANTSAIGKQAGMRALLLALLLALALAGRARAAPATDDQIAKAVVRYAIDAQHHQLIPAVDHVAVVGNYAIADWSSGTINGESLVERVHGSWRVILAGAVAFGARELVHDGISAATAKALIAKIAALERSETEAG